MSKLTRRDAAALIPVLTHLAAAKDAALSSQVYRFDALPVNTNSKTGAQSRQIFHGITHDGVRVDLHITTMPPGQMPHSPHHHAHEEIFLIQQGSLEATINGKSTIAGPGSVIYVHSNDEHGVKATGDVPAQYFVFAIGDVNV